MDTDNSAILTHFTEIAERRARMARAHQAQFARDGVRALGGRIAQMLRMRRF